MSVVYALLFFFSGTLFASFAFVLADRIPAHETILGRSRCDSCRHPLRLFEVLPLLGYLLVRGRCRHCGAKVSFTHVLVELAGGLLFAACYLHAGLTLETVAAVVLVFVMSVESLSDLRAQVVIDRIWIAGIVPVAVIRLLQGDLLPHLFASGVLFLAMAAIGLLGRIAFKKEALGGGDVKLYLFIGFVLTWDEGLLSLFLASFAGFLFGVLGKRRGVEIPLVPFLFAGVLAAYFWGSDLFAWYLRLLGA